MFIIGQFSKVGIWSRAGNEIRSELEPNPTKRSILKNSSTLIVKTRLVSDEAYAAAAAAAILLWSIGPPPASSTILMLQKVIPELGSMEKFKEI